MLHEIVSVILCISVCVREVYQLLWVMVAKGSRGNDSQTGLGRARYASVVAAPPTGIESMCEASATVFCFPAA